MKAIKFELFWIREEESVPTALHSHQEHPVSGSSLLYQQGPSSVVFTDLNCGNMRERERNSFTYVKASCALPFSPVLKKKKQQGNLSGDPAGELKRPP